MKQSKLNGSSQRGTVRTAHSELGLDVGPHLIPCTTPSGPQRSGDSRNPFTTAWIHVLCVPVGTFAAPSSRECVDAVELLYPSHKKKRAMPKTAIITGITGQDAYFLSEYLLALGYQVIGVSRAKSEAEINDRIQIEYGDIADDNTKWIKGLIAKWQPHEMYHLGGQSSKGRAIAEPCETILNTGYTTCVLLQAIREASPATRFFHASSSEIFGNPTESPQTETTVPHPLSPYAVAKMTGHHFLQYYREAYGIFAVSGILYNHESPRRRAEFVTKKIADAVASIVMGEQHTLHLGDLEARRDWGHAKDFVRAMHAALQVETPQDYIIATGTTHSVRDFCEIAFQSQGLNYRNHVVSGTPACLRSGDFHHLVGDTSRANRVLKWTPLYSFADMVNEMVSACLHSKKKRE